MSTPVRFAFVGFRHGHIFSLYRKVQTDPGLEIAAICEENPDQSLLPEQGLEPDFQDFSQMLEQTPCEVVAIGDCYGRRGKLALQALRAGKHVMADKPLCTRLEEAEEIEAVAGRNGLQVGMMLEMRNSANIFTLREVVRSGRIGEIQTACVAGQHPLLHGRRPAWYFQEGMHGGTINDIAIHAVDFLPWITGIELAQVVAARTWNAKAGFCPEFGDCAQFIVQLANGGGVIGDVSYLAPEKCGYKIENYWRLTLHGTRGMLETAPSLNGVRIADDSMEAMETIQTRSAPETGYLKDFLAQIRGEQPPGGLDTAAVLKATKNALRLQLAADTGSPQSLL